MPIEKVTIESIEDIQDRDGKYGPAKIVKMQVNKGGDIMHVNGFIAAKNFSYGMFAPGKEMELEIWQDPQYGMKFKLPPAPFGKGKFDGGAANELRKGIIRELALLNENFALYLESLKLTPKKINRGAPQQSEAPQENAPKPPQGVDDDIPF